jgi:hypothetical protein
MSLDLIRVVLRGLVHVAAAKYRARCLGDRVMPRDLASSASCERFQHRGQLAPRRASYRRVGKESLNVAPALLLIFLGLSCESPKASPGRLVLNEVAALRVADNHRVRGAAISDDSRVLDWTDREVWWVPPGGSDWRSICPDQIHHPAGAAFTKLGSIAVVDASGPQVVSWASGTGCRAITILGRLAITQAAALPSGWALSMDDSSGARLIVYVGPAGDEEWRAVLASEGPATDRRGEAFLMSVGSDILLAEYMWPFRLRRLAKGKNRLHVTSPMEGWRSPELIADTLRNWRALRPFPWGPGMIQTLIDPRSDGRLIVRYGSGDKVESIARVNAPFGLLASSPSGRLVLGYRRLAASELVVYETSSAR